MKDDLVRCTIVAVSLSGLTIAYTAPAQAETGVVGELAAQVADLAQEVLSDVPLPEPTPIDTDLDLPAPETVFPDTPVPAVENLGIQELGIPDATSGGASICQLFNGKLNQLCIWLTTP